MKTINEQAAEDEEELTYLQQRSGRLCEPFQMQQAQERLPFFILLDQQRGVQKQLYKPELAGTARCSLIC